MPVIELIAFHDYLTNIKPGHLRWSLQHVCGTPKTFDELSHCVTEKSFGLNETVEVEDTGVVAGSVFTPGNFSHWNSSLTSTILGMCHTMVYPETIDKTKNFAVALKDNFLVILHDPKFFVLKSDNFFVPHLTLNNPTGKGFRLKAVTKKRMNRAGRFDCHQDQLQLRHLREGERGCKDQLQLSVDRSQGQRSPNLHHHQTDQRLRLTFQQDLIRRRDRVAELDGLSHALHLPGLLPDGLLTAGQVAPEPALPSLRHHRHLAR